MQAGREIKFRVWDGVLQYMIYSEESRSISSFFADVEGKEKMNVMQFTGLRDKNGKEIFEGDILKQNYRAETGSYDDRISYEGHHIGPVIITASKGVCMKNPLCYSVETDEINRSRQYKNVASYRCEIIGNKFSNPELLEVGK
ncbi:YopX family protein [Brevibacillus sp. BC25]|uniref:YopX family protein n=1 Tax=Brevibacillus sp. BC25 TaxID=1144308 RepID=UPI000271304D|nr:YopX family protein [Brevibacillus sp. BC25]EJL29972.1 phage uncharacterized protein TIGR01671 [Brevibacillus sp. BC25]